MNYFFSAWLFWFSPILKNRSNLASNSSFPGKHDVVHGSDPGAGQHGCYRQRGDGQVEGHHGPTGDAVAKEKVGDAVNRRGKLAEKKVFE